MGHRRFAVLAAALTLLGGCSRTDKPAAVAKTAEIPKITQFYATAPQLARGDKELLCYGVEGARSVWLSPPRQELIASLARCVEVTPSANTTYTLTAEGAGGPPVTQELTVTLGPARVKIIEIQVSSVQVKTGDAVSICYKVENAKSVEISPIHFRKNALPYACAVDKPLKTTTYTVTAEGSGGDKDQEHVTVNVH